MDVIYFPESVSPFYQDMSFSYQIYVYPRQHTHHMYNIILIYSRELVLSTEFQKCIFDSRENQFSRRNVIQILRVN